MIRCGVFVPSFSRDEGDDGRPRDAVGFARYGEVAGGEVAGVDIAEVAIELVRARSGDQG